MIIRSRRTANTMATRNWTKRQTKFDAEKFVNLTNNREWSRAHRKLICSCSTLLKPFDFLTAKFWTYLLKTFQKHLDAYLRFLFWYACKNSLYRPVVKLKNKNVLKYFYCPILRRDRWNSVSYSDHILFNLHFHFTLILLFELLREEIAIKYWHI